MEFRIADTFMDSLAKLTGEEQKATKMADFDMQLNPAHLGLQFHKLDATATRRPREAEAGRTNSGRLRSCPAYSTRGRVTKLREVHVVACQFPMLVSSSVYLGHHR
jgi:hypothetical protein